MNKIESNLLLHDFSLQRKFFFLDFESQNTVIGISVGIAVILCIATIVAVIIWKKNGLNKKSENTPLNKGNHLQFP